MTPEAEKRLEAARADLMVCMMGRLPFDISTAGATRIDIYKRLIDEARKMLRRNVPEPSRYEDMARRIRGCGKGSIESLVEGVYRNHETKV